MAKRLLSQSAQCFCCYCFASYTNELLRNAQEYLKIRSSSFASGVRAELQDEKLQVLHT